MARDPAGEQRRSGDQAHGEAAVADLAEVGWLRRARRREPEALDVLWRGEVDRLWSLALAILDGGRGEALEVLGVVRSSLERHAPGLPLDGSWRLQLLRWLWVALVDRLEPSFHDGIPASDPPRADAAGRDPVAAVRWAVRSLPPGWRMVYLFQVLGDLSPSQLAEMSGLPEGHVLHLTARTLHRLAPVVQGGADEA